MPLGAARITLLAKTQVTAVAEVIRAKKGITAVGNAQIDTAQSKFGGGSALFDGSGDYLTIINDDFKFGTNDFTYEFWYYLPTTNTSYYCADLTDATSQTGLSINFVSTNIIRIRDYVSGSGTIIIASGTVIQDATWQHFALVRNSGTLTLYINGTNAGSVSYTTNLQTPYIHLGASTIVTADLNGYMDEVRISNTARYTANFTPSTTPFVNDANTLLLLHMDGTDGSTYFEDDNGVRNKVGVTALGNAQVDTAQSKFGGSSALFDGTGDGLIVADNDNFIMSGDFTIEFWVRWNLAAKEHYIMNNRVGGVYTTGSWQIGRSSSTNPLVWSSPETGNLTILASPSNSVWYHVAVVRSGSTVKTYLDGSNVATGTDSTTLFFTHQQIGIGGYGLATSDWFNGWLDEVRISNTARYTSNFTPSTTPFVNDANTLLLLHMDGTDGSTYFEDDNGVRSKFGITAVGNAQVDTAQSKFGGASALFDGNDDYLSVGNPIDDTSSELTVEAWVRFDISPETQTIGGGAFMMLCTVSSSSYITFYSSSGTGRVQVADSGTYMEFNGGVAWSINTWYHIAVVRNSSNQYRIFVNGTEWNPVGGYTKAGGLFENNTFVIGRFIDVRGSFDGYIDEFRISNTARYTANFTAPTEPFQNDTNTLLLLHMDGTDGSTVFVDDNGVSPDYSY